MGTTARWAFPSLHFNVYQTMTNCIFSDGNVSWCASLTKQDASQFTRERGDRCNKCPQREAPSPSKQAFAYLGSFFSNFDITKKQSNFPCSGILIGNQRRRFGRVDASMGGFYALVSYRVTTGRDPRGQDTVTCSLRRRPLVPGSLLYVLSAILQQAMRPRRGYSPQPNSGSAVVPSLAN